MDQTNPITATKWLIESNLRDKMDARPGSYVRSLCRAGRILGAERKDGKWAIKPVILFAMAGTLHYWQGWLYWAVLLIPMLAAVNYFLRTDPELLERRMKYKRERK